MQNPHGFINFIGKIPSEIVAGISRAYRATVRPSPWDDFWYTSFPGPETFSGVQVDYKTALKFAPIYAAVRRISESIASLPLNLYEISGKNKTKAINHPLWRILHLQPNPEETRMQMWEALIAHLLLQGNCYAQIQRSVGGQILALWPLDPTRITPKRENDVVVYRYRITQNSEEVVFPFWDILHIAGLSYNGLIGYSPITLMRESVGLGLAQEEYAARFYANGATVSGVLETEGLVGKEALEDMRKWFRETYGGVSRAHQIAILQQGLKFHPLSVPQKDSQWLESLKFTVRNVARWFLIPPHMIGDLERATWGNIESQSIDFVVYTLRPWLIRIEQAMQTQFGLADNLEIRHVVEGLLRGDSQARAQFYQSAITNGWMNRNEVRELEDRNPMPGLDEFLVPQSNAAPQSEKGNGKDKKLDKEAFRMMVQKLSQREREEIAEILEG